MPGEAVARDLALLLAYDGTAYRGWQIQPRSATVQGALVAALRPLVGCDVRLIGASRTDAGVHALGQVASFTSATPLSVRTVGAALNATLPRDIRVLDVGPAWDGFDARRSARLKRYGYLISQAATLSPFLRTYAWHVGRPLDVSGMRVALAALRGTHDFSAFQAAAGRDRAPTCTIRAARLVQYRELLGICVSADAFLHHMVRNIVGTIIEVGVGRRRPESMGDLLAGRDRRLAGPTAPAQGLFLLRVRYPLPLFGRGATRAR